MKSFWSAVLLLISIALGAQQVRLSGTVLDFHDHTPLGGAKISLDGRQVAETDAEGRFTISLEKGTANIRISHPECDVLEETLALKTDTRRDFYLEHHEAQIEAVTVAGRGKVSGFSAVQTVRRQAMEENVTQNLGNILTGLSGVNAMKTGNNIAKPVIHGLYGSRILILNNSVRIAEQEWGVEHAPSADPGAFETVTVIKGAGTLKYGGDAAGGVVLLEPKVFPVRDTLAGAFSTTYNSNGRGGAVNLEIAKIWQTRWFVRAQGAYKKLGDISTPDHSLQNTGTVENNLSFTAGYRSFQKGLELYYSGVAQEFGIFRGSHLGTAEDFLNAVNGGQTLYKGNFSYRIDHPKQDVYHQLAKIEVYNRFAKFGKITAQYAFQLNSRKEYDIRRGDYNRLPSMDLRLITHQLKVSNLHEHENWHWETGISAAVQDNFPNPETKARRLIPDYYRYDGGAFSLFEYRFHPKLRAEVGLRYDFNRYDAYKYYDESEWEQRFSNAFSEFFVKNSGSRVLTRPVVDFHNVSANAGISYQLSDPLSLKLNLSRSSRAPNPAELFADGLHHSAAIIERGNLGIGREAVYQANAYFAVKTDWLSGFRMEVSPYYMASENFITQNATGALVTVRGIFPVWDYEQVKARLYGADVDAELKLTPNLKWNGQFGTVYGEDLSKKQPLALMMPTNFRNSLQLDFPDFSKAYLRVEHTAFLRQNRYPDVQVPLSVIENGQLAEKTLDLGTPPAGYGLWNVFAGVRFGDHLQVNAGVTNAANRRYREYLNRLRYFADAQGRNFFLTLIFKF